MGQRNQQRRAEKKRDKQRGSRGSSPGEHLGAGWRGDELLFDAAHLLMSAGTLAAKSDDEGVAPILAAVARQAERRGHAAVGAALGQLFGDLLRSVWEGGWLPSEVARAVRRQRSEVHADLLVTALAADDAWRVAPALPPAAWSAQLEALEVTRWWGEGSDWLGAWTRRGGVDWLGALQVATEALGVLMTLPVIETVLPPPSRWGLAAWSTGRKVDDDPVLAKIRALLAKAESTSFEAEAEALSAKAQELMSRHAIDDAMARAASDTTERPAARRLAVDDPYAAAKSTLLRVVAEANGARSIWHQDLALMTVVGFRADLDAVDLLFTSLLIQGTRGMLAKGRITDGRGRSRTRSFRQSFLIAFAGRIHERLHVASKAARTAAEADLGTNLLPVLVGRDEAVGDAVEEMFPHLVRRNGPSATNRDGWLAGRTAAELATLGPIQGSLPA